MFVPKITLATLIINETRGYPVLPSQTWIPTIPINMSTIKCGMNSLTTNTNYRELQIFLPFTGKTKSGGYLCKKFNHKMTCTSGWTGFSFTNTVSAHPITKEQCVDAISGYMAGKPSQTPLLFPKCSTLSEQSTNNIRVDVEYQIVDLDKGDLSYVHHFFPNGKCFGVYCTTVHPNIFWISENLIPPACDDLKLGRASILLDEYGKLSYSLVDTDYTPPLPLMTGCKGLSYCGRKVLRLETGFILIPSSDNTKLWMDQISTNLPSCNKSTVIKELSEFEMAITQTLHDRLLFHQSQCERVLYSIQSGRSIKSSDLIYLSPILGGPGVTFRLKEGVLNQFSTRWERVSSFEIDCSNRFNCSVKFKKPGYPYQFTLNTSLCEEPSPLLYLKGVRCQWFGGISFGLNGLYYPHRHFVELIEEEYMEALDEGDKYIEPSARPDTDNTIDDDTDPETGTTTYQSWWEALRKYGIWIGMIIITFILLWFIMQCRSNLCSCRLCKNQGNKQRPTVIELRSYNEPSTGAIPLRPKIAACKKTDHKARQTHKSGIVPLTGFFEP